MYKPEQAVFDTKIESTIKLVYGIEDKPKTIIEQILFALQVTLVDFTPFIWAGMFISGAGLDSEVVLPIMISSCFFCMGFCTLLQTTIGNRLPIVQGPSSALAAAMGPVAATYGLPSVWGSVIVGGAIEAFLGGSRIMSKLRALLTPVVVGSVVASIGFVAARIALQWTFSVQTPQMFILALIAFLFAIVLKFKCKGILSQGFILWTVLIVGVGLGTIFGVYNWKGVINASWIKFPGFFPIAAALKDANKIAFLPAAIVGVFSGYMGSMFESVGDYAATCAACNEVYRVKHIDKGIFAEGLGCIFTSVFNGLPCTSYTQNIGIVSATGVCSRAVTQTAAIIFFIYSLCPKMAYLLSGIPRPVIGAVFLITAATMIFSGIDTIRSDKNNLKNTIIAGTTLGISVMLPYHCASTYSAWAKSLPSFLNMLVTSTTFLAVVVGIVLHFIINIVLKAKDE